MKPIILKTKDGVNGKGGRIGTLALFKCNECDKEFWNGISQNKIFCSKVCYRFNQKKSTMNNAMRWKGGKVLQAGYYKIKQPDGKYLFEHRLIMEAYIGRKLKRSEDIHHINGKKTDNRLENLLLITTKQHHMIHYMHTKIDKKTKRFIKSTFLEQFI